MIGSAAPARYPLASPFCAMAPKSIPQTILKKPPFLIILYFMEHGLWESQIRLGCRANCAAVQHLKYTHIPLSTKMRSVGK